MFSRPSRNFPSRRFSGTDRLSAAAPGKRMTRGIDVPAEPAGPDPHEIRELVAGGAPRFTEHGEINESRRGGILPGIVMPELMADAAAQGIQFIVCLSGPEPARRLAGAEITDLRTRQMIDLAEGTEDAHIECGVVRQNQTALQDAEERFRIIRKLGRIRHVLHTDPVDRCVEGRDETPGLMGEDQTFRTLPENAVPEHGHAEGTGAARKGVRRFEIQGDQIHAQRPTAIIRSMGRSAFFMMSSGRMISSWPVFRAESTCSSVSFFMSAQTGSGESV